MNKKGLILLFATVSLLAAGAAIALQPLIIPNNATVEIVGNIDVYVEGELNPSSLNWGTFTPDTYDYMNLTVVNKANGPVTVYILVSGLSSGWTQTWTANDTLLQPLGIAQGDLTLTVPADASAGSYNWDLYVCADES